MKRVVLLYSLSTFVAILIMITFSRSDRETMPETEAGTADTTKAFIASRLSELRFVENRGQFPASVRFSMRYAGGAVSFGKRSVVVNARRSESHPIRPAVAAVLPARFGSRKGVILSDLPVHSEPVIDRLVIDFPGSRLDCEPRGLDERAERSNYFLGSDPDRWRSHVRTYDRLIYRNLYPGIDLMYCESDGALKSDFIVQPGADPDSIKIRYTYSDYIGVDSNGDLFVHYGDNMHIESKPVAFQMIRGRKQFREVAYRILPGNIITYEIGEYSIKDMLVIDPKYCSLIGGTGIDAVGSVVQSTNSKLYVAGRTFSSDFKMYGKPFQSDLAGASDAFITIVDITSGNISNTTYYGGEDDEAMHIKLDAAGRVVAVGTTRSSNLPMAGNSSQPFLAGNMDLFVAIFDSACSRLLHATYLGGSGFDDDFSMTLNPDGDILVTGLTDSRDFPTSTGAFQRTYGGGEDDVFVTRMSSDCSRLVFSTFLGGSSYDEGYGLALDTDENVYIAGYTDSPNFPVTSNAIQITKNPYDEGFIAKLDPSGSMLLYGTYFGGDVYDLVENVCIDPSGNVFVLGRTTSNDLPVTSGAYQASKGDSLNPNPYLSDLFVLRLSTDMSRILACTYIGGSDSEYSGQIFGFDENAILVTGYTESPDYPTVGADAGSYHAEWDVVYSVLSKSLKTVYYSTYFGGNGHDVPNGTFLSPDDIFIGGYTSSQDLPVTPTAFQSQLSGESDGFIAIFDRSRIVTSIQENRVRAKTVTIDQNYPNPATDGWTSIGYSLTPGANATLTVYDRSGRAVKTVPLTKDVGPGGEYRLDISSFRSGVYFYELRTGATSTVRKMLVQQH